MNKVMKWIEEKMTPLANFLGSERHLAAMQKAFMSILPMIFVGAVFMLIANPPVTEEMISQGGFWGLFSGWFHFATANKMTILIPYNMTMGLLSLAVAFFIGYNLAKSYGMKEAVNGMTAMITFFIVAAPAGYVALADGTMSLMINSTYLGAQGMFTAIVIGLLTTEITRFCQEHHITIRLPEVCPPVLTESFATIIPMGINITLFFLLNQLIGVWMPGRSIPSCIEVILAKPVGVVNSVPGAIFLCLFILVLWCCGVHGQMVTMAVTSPITMAAFASNAELFAAGAQPVFHPIFMTLAIAFLGGTGNTFGLCVLSLKAKSEQMKAFGKATIVPSFFRLSEPAIFGAPIMFNPILMIPFICCSLVVAILYWLVCTAGLVTAPYLMISGTYPIFLSIFIYCLDWRVLVFVALMIPLTMVIWYPFFKTYDNQLYRQEQAEKEAAA